MSAARRVVARVVGACLLAFAGIVIAAPASSAEPPDAYGWWGVYQQAPGGSNLPTPPGIPEDGIYVAGDNTALTTERPGVTAFAAIRVVIAEDSPARITLKVADGFTAEGAVIAACPTTSNWDPFLNGRWEGRPSYDCVAGLDGVVAETGDTVVFDLPATLQKESTILDVAIVPRTASQVAFQRPDDTSIQADFDLSDGEEGGGGDPSGDAFVPGVFDPPANFLFDTPGLDGPIGTPDFGAFEPVTPEEPVPSAFGGQQAFPTFPGVRAVAIPDERGDRILAVLLFLAIAGGLWWIGGTPVRLPQRLGSLGIGELAAAAASPLEGARLAGVGRFARLRAEGSTPHRL